MASTGRIFPGSRVSGSHGSLIPNPKPNAKRRVQSKAVWTVMSACGAHKWNVLFDFDSKVKTVMSKSLKVVDTSVGIPLNEATFNEEVGTSGVHISVPVGIDDPAVTDAVDETEDHNEPHMMEEDQTLERVDPNADNNEQDESEDEPECHPNNDF